MKELRSSAPLLSALVVLALLPAAARAQATGVNAWGDHVWGKCDVPALPPGLDYVQIDAGYFYTAALRSDGSIVTWGSNRTGEGDVPALPEGLRYVEVSAGGTYGGSIPDLEQHAAARRSDGSIVAWGFNLQGQCDVPALPAGLTYLRVSAGSYHTAAVRSDGALIAWGRNDSGQCNVPPLPPGLAYVEVAAGGSHTVALRSDGSVVAWGSNGYGQCNVPVLSPGLTYARITAEHYCNLAVLSDGSGIGWGADWNGMTSVPALPPGMSYRQFALGNSHSLALRSDGAVLAWGWNGSGQCNVPGAPGGRVYLDITAGSDHSVARWALPPTAPSTYCTAKTNSLGCAPVMGFNGQPALSGADDFVAAVSQVHNQRLGFVFWGFAANASPFHGGTLCIASPLVRTGALNSGGSTSGDDCSGSLSQPFTHAYLFEHGLGVGDELFVQAWSRDTGTAPFQVSLSDALHVVVNP